MSWKVYESEPSVTMLRMFARYAGDDVNIRPITELEHDFVVGNVPSVVVIEPAMHHQPQDDDHPDADMYRGQHFLRRVYSAVTANPQVWARTLLIITYDEHGGFYDHVVPPVADVFEPARPVVAGSATPRGATSGGGSTTPPVAGPGGVVSGAGGLHINPGLLGVLSGDRIEPVPGNVPVKVPYDVRPTFVVSPWVSPGKGPSVVLDHCSIVKTILARFCGDKKPFLNDRVHVSRSFESFLTESAPRAVPPPAAPPLRPLSFPPDRRIPGSSRIITRALFRKRMREEPVDYHEVSGRLARMLGR